MSRSNPHTSVPSPAVLSWEWKGDKDRGGVLQWYDKDKQENVEEELPFSFLLLERLATVTGFSEPMDDGFYSNLVRDTREQPFVVKTNKGRKVFASGLWADVKDKVKAAGGKFAAVLIVAFYDEKELKVGKVLMGGCALGPWIEFEQEAGPDLYKQAVIIDAGELQGKGIKFVPPTFKLRPVKPETDAAATALDKAVVQPWLTEYFKRPVAARTEQQEEREPERPEPGKAREKRKDDYPEEPDAEVPF